MSALRVSGTRTSSGTAQNIDQIITQNNFQNHRGRDIIVQELVGATVFEAINPLRGVDGVLLAEAARRLDA
jgi:hypothetical protein